MELCAFDKLFTKSVPHILEKTFLSLDYKSFKTCLDVSKTWNELLKSDSYRTKGRLVFNAEILEEEETLWWAARNGFIAGKEVRKLLSTGLLDVNFTMGLASSTPLYEAARYGHKHMVQLLLERGADPNKREKYGWTPLFGAISGAIFYPYKRKGELWDWKDVVEMLLRAGAELNAVDHMGRTPLFLAANYGHKEAVTLLLHEGADHTIPSNDGLTPLQTAEERGHTNVAKILRERGVKKRRM